MPETIGTGKLIARRHEVPFFRELPGELIDTIRRSGTVRHFTSGEPLFLQGEAPKGLFIVVRGQVRVYQIGRSGREHVLAMEGPGSSVAELPLFDGEPYPAYAEAVEESTLFTLGQEPFAVLLREHPEVAQNVIRALAQRLRRLVQTMEGLALKEVRQRVAGLLLQWAEEHGPEFMLPVSNEQLAAQLGTVREVVSRAVHGFAHDRLIALDGRRVTVLDLEGLRERT